MTTSHSHSAASVNSPNNECHAVKRLLEEFCHNPLYWMVVFVPIVIVSSKLMPESHTLLFVLSVLAIVPLAALLLRESE